MNQNVNLIYAYLFDREDSLENKINVCNRLCSIWRGNEPFQIIPNILKALTETGEVPSYEHYVEYYSFLQEYDKPDIIPSAPEIINLIEKEHTNALTKEVAAEIQDALAKTKDTEETADLMDKLSLVMTKYNASTDADQELTPAKQLYEERKNRSRGILTGLEPIDNLVYSFEMGTISVIAAPSGFGKTTVAKSVLYTNAVQLGYNVLFVSLEMPREQILFSILSRHSQHEKFKNAGDPIEFSRIQHSELSPEEEEFLFDVVDEDLRECSDYGKIEIVGSQFFRSFTDYGMRAAISKLPFKPDLIIVDYIQMLNYIGHPAEIYKMKNIDPANYYIQQIKNLAENMDGQGRQCHCMLLSQLNKEGQKYMDANEGRAQLTALAQFNELARTPSYVFFLWKNNVLKENNECLVFLAKNRFGETMTDPCIINFDPRYSRVGSEISVNPTSVDFGDLLN